MASHVVQDTAVVVMVRWTPKPFIFRAIRTPCRHTHGALRPRPVLTTPPPSFEETIPVKRLRKFLPEEDALIMHELSDARAAGRKPSRTQLAQKLERNWRSVDHRIDILTHQFKVGRFTEAEDFAIRQGVHHHKLKGEMVDWKSLGYSLQRGPSTVKSRWSDKLSETLTRGPWKLTEDEAIMAEGLAAAKQRRLPNWQQLSAEMKRGPTAIALRWRGVLNPALKWGRWSSKENDFLIRAVQQTAEKGQRISWTEIGREIQRSGKAVRTRWDHLKGICKQGPFTASEDAIILERCEKGKSWDDIAVHVKRSERSLKKRYVRLKLRQKAQQPVQRTFNNSGKSDCICG